MLTGVGSGVAGGALVLLLHLVQHLVFGACGPTFLDDVEGASPARRVLAPAAAGLVVGLVWWWRRRTVSAEDVSVTRALREPGHHLPLGATTVDAVLQVVAVGAGASLGREGAPRQTGAALARCWARLLRLPPDRTRTLLACGAGAGLAAVYDVPLSGALFALEILLASFALRDVVPALVASATATVVAWPVVGRAPVYAVTGVRLDAPVLVFALVAGPLAAGAGIGFDRLTTWARTHARTGRRAVLAGAAVLGALGAASLVLPELLGNGKAPAQLAFAGTVGVGTALVLVVLKPLASSAGLGAGLIGGLLTPAFATGAMLGVVCGTLWTRLWPGAPLVDYVLVGAAGLLAVTQRAPLTGTVLSLELVRSADALVLPVLVAALLGCLVAWRIDPAMRPALLRARPVELR